MSNDKSMGQIGWAVLTAIIATVGSHYTLRYLAKRDCEREDRNNAPPSTGDPDDAIEDEADVIEIG